MVDILCGWSERWKLSCTGFLADQNKMGHVCPAVRSDRTSVSTCVHRRLSMLFVPGPYPQFILVTVTHRDIQKLVWAKARNPSITHPWVSLKTVVFPSQCWPTEFLVSTRPVTRKSGCSMYVQSLPILPTKRQRVSLAYSRVGAHTSEFHVSLLTFNTISREHSFFGG